MRRTYHICIASHDEVMFRSPEDYIRGFNHFACAVLETESRALGDGEMSTHCHFGVQTDSRVAFISKFRYGYTRYFNAKYHRKGRLGERNCFWLELDGVRHVTAALSYILRQGLHHGITSTPYEYPYCSANVIFQKELGKRPENELLHDSKRSRYLPRDVKIDTQYRMDTSGLLLREDIIDTRYVEELYISPKNFLFQMNRNSDDSWIKDQSEEDSISPIITLDKIEPGVADFDISSLIANEKGRPNKSWMHDMELCQLIDNEYVPRYFSNAERHTVYDLSDDKRADLANQVYAYFESMRWNRKPGVPVMYITKEQLDRCAVIH